MKSLSWTLYLPLVWREVEGGACNYWEYRAQPKARIGLGHWKPDKSWQTKTKMDSCKLERRKGKLRREHKAVGQRGVEERVAGGEGGESRVWGRERESRVYIMLCYPPAVPAEAPDLSIKTPWIFLCHLLAITSSHPPFLPLSLSLTLSSLHPCSLSISLAWASSQHGSWVPQQFQEDRTLCVITYQVSAFFMCVNIPMATANYMTKCRFSMGCCLLLFVWICKGMNTGSWDFLGTPKL